MDDLLHPDGLHSLSTSQVLSLSLSLPRSSPQTFYLLTLTLVFPLSFVILAHSLFIHPLFLRTVTLVHPSEDDIYLLVLLYQLIYLLLLFSFTLLSTAAFGFSVASLNSLARPLSFTLFLSALPTILPRLLRTFLWISLLLFLYNLIFVLSGFHLPFSLVSITLVTAHVYLSALWHLASVVSVLEPVSGLSALSRARQLLRGKTHMATSLMSAYLTIWSFIGLLFRAAVVAGPNEDFSLGIRSVAARGIIGAVLVGVLVVVNLIGLLAQSVFYYVCKSYHGQGIDREALSDHVGGYLGENVPLKISIQLESL